MTTDILPKPQVRAKKTLLTRGAPSRIRTCAHGYEGLALNFEGDKFDPVRLQTKPVIRLDWNVLSVGTW